MKNLTLIIILNLLCLNLLAKETQPTPPNSKSINRHARLNNKENHYKKNQHPHTYQMHIREEEESFDSQRKEMNIKISELENLLKKNKLALGVERRQIRNLSSGDSRNKAKMRINAICDEIKEGVNQFQSQIGSVIDTLD